VAISQQLITTIQSKTLSDNNQQITARILNAMEIYQHQSMKQQYGAIAGRGKTSEWTVTDELDYEKLDLDISQEMKHVSRMSSLRKKIRLRGKSH
jgi:hypothetical protein